MTERPTLRLNIKPRFLSGHLIKKEFVPAFEQSGAANTTNTTKFPEKSTTSGKTSSSIAGAPENNNRLSIVDDIRNNSDSNNNEIRDSNIAGNNVLVTTATTNDTKSSSKSPSKKPFISPEEYSTLLQLVQEKYPDTFPRDPSLGSGVRVLAIGIHEQLVEQLGVTRNLVRKFLRKYSTRKAYKAARQVGADRYDLAGNIVGKVTEKEVY